MNVLWAVYVVIGMHIRQRFFNVFVAVLVYVVRVLILKGYAVHFLKVQSSTEQCRP